MKKFLVKYFFPAMMIMGGGKFMTSCRGSSNQPIIPQTKYVEFTQYDITNANRPAFTQRLHGYLSQDEWNRILLTPRLPAHQTGPEGYGRANRTRQVVESAPQGVISGNPAVPVTFAPSASDGILAMWESMGFTTIRAAASTSNQNTQ